MLPKIRWGEWRLFLQKYDLWCYGFLLLVAASVAFFRIGYQSLWNDEVTSAIFATRYSLAAIWEYVPKHDLHPPLYYSILHGWSLIFGGSEAALRSMSAVFFCGTVLLIYRLALRLSFSRQGAFLTALLYATNPFAVLYAQETRSYAMLLFFVVASTSFFYTLISTAKPSWVQKMLYVLTIIVLVYTNIVSLVLPFAHACVVLYLRRKELIKRFVPLYLVIGISALPILRFVQSANNYDYSYYNPERFSFVMKAVVVGAGFIGGRINVLNGKWHIYPLLILSFLIYGIVTFFIVRQWRTVNRHLVLIFFVLFFSILVLTHIKFPVPDPKYLYPAFPFFILLVGYIFSEKQKKKTLIFFVTLLFGLNSIFLYHYYFTKKYERENWRSVVAQVEADVPVDKEKNAVVIAPFPVPHPMWLYYEKKNLPKVGALEGGGKPEEVRVTLQKATVSEYDTVYISRFIFELYDPADTIRTYVEEQGFVKTGEFKDTKVEFWRYEKKDPV
jgi:4-amino-4-deoxy-L-arabinose transferase-like glycosyltransferase